MEQPTQRPRMLVFDPAYTYQMLMDRQLVSTVTGRDLQGYFDHVWTVHTLAGLFLKDDDPAKYGVAESRELAPGPTFIEGKIAYARKLRWIAPLNLLIAQVKLMRYLFRIIRENDITIIRSEEAWYNGLVAWITARRFRLPLVVGVWGDPSAIRARTGKPLMPRLLRWIWLEEAIERFVLRRADRVVVMDEHDRNFVISRGTPPERAKIFRIGNLLNERHFVDPKEREDGTADLAELGADGAETLLCISRLERLKLTDHVVRVLGLLKDRRPKAKVIFAGDGPQKPELEALAEELGVRDRVIFAGNRDQAWLSRVAPKVSAVISPLTGRALAEAALGEAPIVAYDIIWHAEIAHPGHSGELVPNLDYEAMADATERLLADPERARELGRNARRVVLDLLDLDKLRETQRTVHTELLEEWRRR